MRTIFFLIKSLNFRLKSDIFSFSKLLHKQKHVFIKIR